MFRFPNYPLSSLFDKESVGVLVAWLLVLVISRIVHDMVFSLFLAFLGNELDMLSETGFDCASPKEDC